MTDDEVLHYYSLQNERLGLALNPNMMSHNPIKNPKLYDKIAQDEEQAKERQLKTLVQNGRNCCEEFLSKHVSEIEKDLELVFGKDGDFRNVLRDIYEKIEEDREVEDQLDSSEKTEGNPTIFQSSRQYLNLKYQEVCPRCSNTNTQGNGKAIVKELMVYERAKFSKKSFLLFNTRHKGMVVQVRLAHPCPSCCHNFLPSGQLEIETIPYIEDEYLKKDKLLESPRQFVEDCIWAWINDHR